MIERNAINVLRRLSEQFPVIGIVGPRQSGKSTLAKYAFPEKQYVTFDEKNMRTLAKENPDDFVSAFPDGAIFDEVQKVPEIFDAVKMNVDSTEYTPGKYILTGSSQYELRKNMTDSMAGRATFVKLLPFSGEELKAHGILPNDIYSLALKGQYPPLYDEEKNYISSDWYESYVDTYLDLDVADNIREDNLALFKKFIRICAVYSGGLLSMDKIASDVGVSSPTIKNWLSILQTSFIIHLLVPESGNIGKSLIKTPKLYFTDSGLLCHLLNIETREELLLSRHKGAVVETYAISELLKKQYNNGKPDALYFYREQAGTEVDIVADWKNKYAIEVKSSKMTEKKFANNIKKYSELHPDDNLIQTVFYTGDMTMRINDVNYVNWREWGELVL